jgi:hypothetical protein
LPAGRLLRTDAWVTLAGAMIHDVDESLRALVRRDALNGSRVDIAFDAPTKDWVARQNAPTVNLYLYDIREDLERRQVAWERQHNNAGRVMEHRPPPRRYRLSYLVTAWTQRPEDEHRLLSAMLSAFLRHPTVPDDVLAGSLTDVGVPVYMTVALPPPADRSLADVWSALGGELKPSLDLVVTAPMDVSMRIEAAPPVLEQPRFRVVRADGTVEYVEGSAGAGAAGPTRVLSPADDAAQEETIIADASAMTGESKGITRGGKGRAKPAEATAPPEPPGRRIKVRGINRP